MIREHRVLDGETGDLVVTPFTAEEEAAADQKAIDDATAAAAFNDPNARMDRAFTLSDKDRLIFKTLFELINRIIALEGGVAITTTQFKTFLKSKLP